MAYYERRGIAGKYLNYKTLLFIFVAIPVIVLAILMSYVMYLAVTNNLNTLVSMITPGLLFVLTYGTIAVVIVVIVMLLYAIVKYAKYNIR
jgi:uncharacterized BrkB/YihY/UPF0761 family membrane protein